MNEWRDFDRSRQDKKREKRAQFHTICPPLKIVYASKSNCWAYRKGTDSIEINNEQHCFRIFRSEVNFCVFLWMCNEAQCRNSLYLSTFSFAGSIHTTVEHTYTFWRALHECKWPHFISLPQFPFFGWTECGINCDKRSIWFSSESNSSAYNKCECVEIAFEMNWTKRN